MTAATNIKVENDNQLGAREMEYDDHEVSWSDFDGEDIPYWARAGGGPTVYNNGERFKEIWGKLSEINVNAKTAKKGNLTYLSWAWAWEACITNFPDSQYHILEENTYPDGSMMTGVSLTINGVSRYMWLPVMDNRNKAIQNPGARDISDTRMRCLVKVMAMFGLGHYIYAGEDLPTISIQADGSEQGERATTVPASKDIKPEVMVFEVFLDEDHTKEVLNKYWLDNKEAIERIRSIDSGSYDRILALFKEKAKAAEAAEGNE